MYNNKNNETIMNTKNSYIEPEMKTVVMVMPTALLAGSNPNAGVDPSGQDWGDE